LQNEPDDPIQGEEAGIGGFDRLTEDFGAGGAIGP